MFTRLKENLKSALNQSLQDVYSKQTSLPSVELEIPTDNQHGEFSTNIALKLSKILSKNPMDIATEFETIFNKAISESSLESIIEKIEVKKPGFINFFITRKGLYSVLYQIFEEQNQYGALKIGQGKKWQIEFVSANPTGPLSVAHARQAAVGDVLGNILNFLGFNITKEYYVNDEGNQINLLGKSISCRVIEKLGGDTTFPEDGYQGEYIKDMAQLFIDENSILAIEDLDKHADQDYIDWGVNHLLDVIKNELNEFGVHFDQWSYQSKIATKENIDEILKNLDGKGLTYQKEGALWFKSTQFGDDKDRVLQKSDGNYTYLTPDIVYHKNKFDRFFSKVFNIWGPDHHGYIKRIEASVEACGASKDALKVLIVQLATIYRDGKPISMSTRKGQYISLREVIDEVGVDASRFFFLMRHINVHLDFDLELAKKETPENPVYYIQYAHARIHSVIKKAQEASISPKTQDFSLLNATDEIDLIKNLGHFSDALLICFHQTDPFGLINYLQELAASFHKFYDSCRIIDQNQDLSSERLALIHATKIVLANGLCLLGVSTPEKM